MAWVDHAWCRAEVEEGYHVGGVLVAAKVPLIRLEVELGHVVAVHGARRKHMF